MDFNSGEGLARSRFRNGEIEQPKIPQEGSEAGHQYLGSCNFQ